jgi:DNA segregation ATPase FtsK/SpoIIIE, S-DNA-T family
MPISKLTQKTPIKNEMSNHYYLEEVNTDAIHQILSSRFITEGVYTLEKFQLNDIEEVYLTLPSFEKRYDLESVDKNWDFNKDEVKEMSIYEVVLTKPMFMPIDIKQFSNLIKEIEKFTHSPIITQMLITKRNDDWRETAISQYEDYLSGNDHPSSVNTVRRIQSSVVNILNKVGGFATNRNTIEEIEQKILQPNYRFELRFILYYSKYNSNFVDFINKKLRKLTLFNEIKLKKANKKETLICFKNREFKPHSVNQLLTANEICSLMGDKPFTEEKEKLSTPIKKTNIQESQLLQRATQIMPYKDKEIDEIDNDLVERINNSFIRTGVTNKKFKVIESKIGYTFMKVQLEIPADVMFTSVTRKLKDIQSALGSESLSIDMGDKPDTINVFMPLQQRNVFYFRKVLESLEFQDFVKNNPLPFIIGEKASGGYKFACLSNLRHLMVTGATGSGKSVFLNLIILSLLLNVSPEELSLYLVDPKVVEFSQFNGFPQVKKIITDMKKADALLASLVEEMEKRYKIFAETGVKNIGTYNQKSNQKMAYTVVVIDEYADLVMINDEVEDHIVRLSQKARAAGIHIILATQKPLSDIVTSVLKSNLPSVISFRLKTSSDYRTVFGKGIPYELLGKGDGVAQIEGQHKEYERFQSPTLTVKEADEEEIYDQLKLLFTNVSINDNEIKVIEEEEPIDKLKRFIANTGETRLTKWREELGIKMDAVYECVKQLLEEGWIEKQGSKYLIIADEEEIGKWRDNNEERMDY